MFVSRLALDDFRSWHQLVVDFEPGLNVLVGANGLGKTNIVEALEVLSTGSSHRTTSSAPLVRAGTSKATVRANVEDSGVTTLYEVSIPVRGANRARINSGKSLYMRDVVGKIPSVTFSPEDQRLVSADPANRRSFLNQAASQLLLDYYDALQRFNQTAKQRSALLRQLSQRQMAGAPVDAALSGLEIWTGQFIETGMALTSLRAKVVERLDAPFSRIYRALAGDRHHARLVYAPSFEEMRQLGVIGEGDAAADARMNAHAAISQHFQRIYAGEVARAQNLIGPHRDDVIFELNGLTAREYASNGEMWTLALALKMALFELLKDGRGDDPLLILDDVFAQLDESRRRQIVDFAGRQSQVLITMAAETDMPAGLEANRIDVQELIDAAA
ncbi:DNA replication/repair protein RecF [Bifidobacterium sp. SMB2]|uniref:DNA replication and repair protein RecF n=1 Tax=Bifidobacterium saimiriisciurei TaxID=2661627 RepID=A0ABX0CGY8_9BIFI|nr:MULTISPECIES: DNA replication/repair protein RecF [Bifidobacterium]NEG95532.1 DNA replication/repair protein RecF [Bifidobacterium sp. SMB2]NEH11690.1 DNA replication/repair protein RecF [Bifidobacterium saimiriisciurei]